MALRFLRSAWRRLVGRLDRPMLLASGKFPVLSDLYFCINDGFRREHRAVIAAQVKHLRTMESRGMRETMFVLRRNTHRLEKGLIMRPRRSVFALDYLEETVSAYVACKNREEEIIRLDDGTLLEWGSSVLSNYFSVVGEHEKIAREKKRYEEAGRFATGPEGSRVPYQRNLETEIPDYQSIYNLAHRRRSVRWFLPRPVPRELLDKAILVGLQSPSACNRQPFHFRIFDEPELVQKIGAIPMGTKGFVQNFQTVIVIVGQLNAFPFSRDRHVIYIDASLAAMAMQFALESLGLSSCCINWPDIPQKEKDMAKALNLKPHERVIMLMAVGYPDPEGLVPYSQKQSLDEARSYNVV